MQIEIDSSILLSYSNLIIKNIEERGWERYDPVDLRYLPAANRGLWSRKFILLSEMFMPIYIRKILGIKKKSYPTAYSFAAGAYGIFEKCGISTSKTQTAVQVIEKCIEKYVSIEDEEIWWNYQKNVVFYPEKSRDDKRPTMCLHFISRCGQALYTIGKLYHRKDLIDLSKKSLDKTLKYHEIIETGEEQESICYYYNSKESTINVNTEMLEWMALYDDTDQYSDHMQRILNMVVSNQQKDGSWYYFSVWHKENIENNLGAIDAHHTATVIYNLIHYAELQNHRDLQKVIISINRGMDYFLKNFFDPVSGLSKVIMGRKRTAGPVQYAESVIALVDFIKSPIDFDKEVRTKAQMLLPKIMKQMICLINKSDGSVSSDKIIRRIHLDSIRWGNGPVLYAIAKYMEFCQE